MASPTPAETPPAFAHRWIAQRAAWMLGAVLLLTLLALAQLVDWQGGRLRLGIDPSLDPLVARDHPDRLYYEEIRRRFGNDERVLVLLHGADALSPGALRRAHALGRALMELPGVEGLTSLTTVPLAQREEGRIELRRIAPEEFDDPALSARLRAAVADHPLYRDQLVTADGRSLALVLELEPLSDSELLALDLAARIREVAAREAGPEYEVRITGAPILRAATSEAVSAQLRWVVPSIIALLSLFLALSFRSVYGVLLPLLTIAVASLWTLAVLSALGRPLNLITSLVPPLLVTMGLAYCAHTLSEFDHLARLHPHEDPRQRITRLLREIAGPVTLTGVTTAVGLLALVINELPAIREFAWLSTLGVVFLALLALTFLPAMLCYVRPRRSHPQPSLFERASRRLGEFDMRHRRAILVVACIALLLAVAASTRIEVGDRFVGVFQPQSQVRQDFEAIDRALGGVNPVTLVVDADTRDGLITPEHLRALDDFGQWLRRQPEVGHVTGLTDHLRVLSETLTGEATGRLPESTERAQQLLFFGDSRALRSLVDADRSTSLIQLRLRVDETAEVTALLERIRLQARTLPRQLHLRATGNTVLVAESVERVTAGQLQSIALALMLVFACLAVQFWSLSVGLLAALPTFLQTALYFGGLGLSGVSLNSTTSLVECLVLGLAVDDTIHYLARFNGSARSSGSESKAAVSALSAVLRPITLTKAMLALGFLMLVTGDLHNQAVFGWLAAGTLFAAWLVDVFVTPAFMSGVRVVTLWDSLRIDLGTDVQNTIPLFAGMTTRQARIFAVMAHLQTVPAGTRLMSEGDSSGDGKAGDPAGDIYVVIDGELGIWIERNGARRDLATVGRGAVVGEIGYFGQKRMANVDTLTPVRLLRFDDADQERICRRYPAIAARVFLNLNRLQAERRAERQAMIS